VHPTTGGSQLSISFRIGRYNATFHVISKIQTTKISINPTHSEYNAFSIATEHIKFYRRCLAWLGYPQLEPTPLENGRAPAFSILIVQDRNVREAYRDQILTPVHFLSKKTRTQSHLDPRTFWPREPSSSTSTPTLTLLSTSNSRPVLLQALSYIFELLILFTQVLLIFARWHVSTKIYLSGA
jgi:hypothetical protein